MKRFFCGLMLVMLLSLGIAPAASADPSELDKGCPNPSFELHHVADHDHHYHGHHPHVGSDTDHNGDGYICVKPLLNGKHLHIDNNVPN
ncbi:MAG: hypothetical protein DPW09_01240 [Anaerolineae bacterium]|nr:hypothetical protein [Anaerolineae bacterium]